MRLAVSSVAAQVTGALEGKVEILVTDNASGPETKAALQHLAETYPSVNYLIHAENMGGAFQIYAAPHRARGRWTWVFGDDDALDEGGLEPIVALLESKAPAFLSLNRQVWNQDFSQRLTASKHALPDLRFPTFLGFLERIGFDQLSFLTSQVYETAAARALDTEPYFASQCAYGQMAYYLEGFHDRSTAYFSGAYVKHRWNHGAQDVHAHNFHHLGVYLPQILEYSLGRAGLSLDFFERIAGRRAIERDDQPWVSFVDNILENLWRSIGVGKTFPPEDWALLDRQSAAWRPERPEQLRVVREAHDKVGQAYATYQTLIAQHKEATRDLASLTPADVARIEQMEEVIYSLQDTLNKARAMAIDVSHSFHPL